MNLPSFNSVLYLLLSYILWRFDLWRFAEKLDFKDDQILVIRKISLYYTWDLEFPIFIILNILCILEIIKISGNWKTNIFTVVCCLPPIISLLWMILGSIYGVFFY